MKITFSCKSTLQQCTCNITVSQWLWNWTSNYSTTCKSIYLHQCWMFHRCGVTLCKDNKLCLPIKMSDHQLLIVSPHPSPVFIKPCHLLYKSNYGDAVTHTAGSIHITQYIIHNSIMYTHTTHIHTFSQLYSIFLCFCIVSRKFQLSGYLWCNEIITCKESFCRNHTDWYLCLDKYRNTCQLVCCCCCVAHGHYRRDLSLNTEWDAFRKSGKDKNIQRPS